MIGRLLRKPDFERVLAVPPCSRSTHFAVHHLRAWPSAVGKGLGMDGPEELCTGRSPLRTPIVDNSPVGHWLGQVIPKRHAPKSVTRNMLRRQVRAAMQRHERQLPPGIWLVRLRQSFATARFRSADSRMLRSAAAAELDRLLLRASQ